jgi:hypothetical protein
MSALKPSLTAFLTAPKTKMAGIGKKNTARNITVKPIAILQAVESC